MSVSDRWLLPDGIEELLPSEAKRVEHLRRTIFSLFDNWGYELVFTPLLEHLDSLLVGSGSDLEQYTYKIVDQSSGRLVGVRADMTPQVARIDAHRIKREGPARYCYWGPVLLTKPRELGGSRSPIQVGAELFGHDGTESDLEIIQLMLSTLGLAGVDDVYLDLAHVDVFRSLIKQANVSDELEALLFDALQRKAKPELAELVQQIADRTVAEMLEALLELNGDVSVIAEAKECLAKAAPSVLSALNQLQEVADVLQQTSPHTRLHVDLAELRGYGYHTGLVFTAYTQGASQAVAMGGRYNDIGSTFGRSRAATGFSLDLRSLIGFKSNVKKRSGIFAPSGMSSDLLQKIKTLRDDGNRVIQELPRQKGDAIEAGCDRQLVNVDGMWQVIELESE